MVCDAHIHYIPEELSVHTSFYKGVWSDKEALFSYLDKNNIDKALLAYPSTDAHLKLKSFSRACQIYNKALEGLIKKNKKIVAAAAVDVEDLGKVSAKVKEFKEKGFRALSIASSYNGSFMVDQLEPLFESAAKNNMPLFVHPQTINPIGYERVKDPLLMPVLEYSFDSAMFMGLLAVKKVLNRHKVSFIFSSLGGPMPILGGRFDRVYSMLLSRGIIEDLGALPSSIFKSIYVDTSGASLKSIQLALDLFGEDKLLWGSDYPVISNTAENIALFDSFSSLLRENILYKNFKNLFKL